MPNRWYKRFTPFRSHQNVSTSRDPLVSLATVHHPLQPKAGRQKSMLVTLSIHLKNTKNDRIALKSMLVTLRIGHVMNTKDGRMNLKSAMRVQPNESEKRLLRSTTKLGCANTFKEVTAKVAQNARSLMEIKNCASELFTNLSLCGSVGLSKRFALFIIVCALRSCSGRASPGR